MPTVEQSALAAELLRTARLFGAADTPADALRVAGELLLRYRVTHEARFSAGGDTLSAEVGRPGGPALVLHGHLEAPRSRLRVEGSALRMPAATAAIVAMLHALRLLADGDARVRLHLTTNGGASREALGPDDYLVVAAATSGRVRLRPTQLVRLTLEVRRGEAGGRSAWDDRHEVADLVGLVAMAGRLSPANESAHRLGGNAVSIQTIDAARDEPGARCTATLLVRLPIDADPDALLRQLRAMEPGVRVFQEPPERGISLRQQHPIARTLCTILAGSTALDSVITERDAWTQTCCRDAPGVELGPRGSRARVELEDLASHVQTLVRLARAARSLGLTSPER